MYPPVFSMPTFMVSATRALGKKKGENETSGTDVKVLPFLFELNSNAPPPEVEAAVREGKVTTYEDWRKIDAEELRRGEAVGQDRERMMAWEEAQAFLQAQKRSK